MTDEYNEVRKKLRGSEGALQYHIDLFGDKIAEREKYKELTGIEAVWFYLIQKYNWTPATVKSLNFDDLQLLLKEEMSGWTAAK